MNLERGVVCAIIYYESVINDVPVVRWMREVAVCARLCVCCSCCVLCVVWVCLLVRFVSLLYLCL